MEVTKNEMNKLRLGFVHQMHNYIMDTGDENIYEVWARDGISDNPDEENFEFFAYDQGEFKYLCELFGRLVC